MPAAVTPEHPNHDFDMVQGQAVVGCFKRSLIDDKPKSALPTLNCPLSHLRVRLTSQVHVAVHVAIQAGRSPHAWTGDAIWTFCSITRTRSHAQVHPHRTGSIVLIYCSRTVQDKGVTGPSASHMLRQLTSTLPSLRNFLPVAAQSICVSGNIVTRQRHGSQQASHDTNTRVTSLRDQRSVLRLAGPDLFHFLQVNMRSSNRVSKRIEIAAPVRCMSQRSFLAAQGLLTNDVTRLEAPDAEPMYACILNAHGRYLHDLMLYKVPGMHNLPH